MCLCLEKGGRPPQGRPAVVRGCQDTGNKTRVGVSFIWGQGVTTLNPVPTPARSQPAHSQPACLGPPETLSQVPSRPSTEWTAPGLSMKNTCSVKPPSESVSGFISWVRVIVRHD